MSDREGGGLEFDFDAYRRFITQVQLQDIWLASSKLENKHGPETPDQVRVAITDTASWTKRDDGFRAMVRYAIRFKVGARMLASVEATFAADFDSDEPMSEELFQVFAVNNLPLNTWPYVREFTASAVSRMGWTPFTLPVRRINVDRR